MHRRGNIAKALPALVLASLLAIPLYLPADTATSPRALTVWFESATIKVKPLDPASPSSAVWDGTTIRLSAARGEHESFQAVLTATAFGVASVRLSSFSGPYTLPEDSIELYQVGYPSAVNQEWPDPLGGFACSTVANIVINFASTNYPVIVDMFVPYEAAAGQYTANLTITYNTDTILTPVILTVWDITLPQTPTLKTWFDDSTSEWASWYGYQPWSPEYDQLMRNVSLEYRKFRISPGNIALGQVGRYNMTVNNGVVSVDFSGTDPWLEYCLDELNFTSFRFPLTGYSPRRADEPPGSGHPDEIYYWGAPPYDMNPTYADHIGQYIKLVADHYRQKGWLDKAYVYVTDEPIAFNDAVDSYWQHPDYHVVRQFYDLVKANAPDLKFVNTVQPVPELFNYTDIWAVPGSYYHELDAQARMDGNQSVWWYNVDAGIASDGTEGRALYWDTFSRGVQGVLYWGTNYWDYDTVNGDPWEGSNSNGDGYLFYPDGQYPVEPFVCPSIRLLLARDGIEDYELLNIYGERYGMDAARAVAESVAVGSSFAGARFKPIDDQLIYDVREWLAGQITRQRDFQSWTDTFHDAANISMASNVEPDFAWEGSYSLAPANPAVTVDSLDSLGGWHPNSQAHIYSSVAIDGTVKTEGTGSLQMDFWRDDDPGELGGYDHMRNGRVVTTSLTMTDWSGYDILEMDVRSVEHPPGNLFMLIGDAGGAVVSSDLHSFSRYTGGPNVNWTHVVVDISGRSRSSIQYIEPIVYNYFLEMPYHHYSYWLDNITLRKAGSLPAGQLVSKPIDLGPVGRFRGLDCTSQWAFPAGDSISFETRTSADLATWSSWAPARPDAKFHMAIDSPPARYFQYRANFLSDGPVTPVLSEVGVEYETLASTDLFIDKLAFDPPVPNENDTFNITVTVGNHGRLDVKGAAAVFSAQSGPSPQPIAAVRFDIPANSSMPLKINWSAPANPPDLNVSARITPPPGINDTDSSNDGTTGVLHINAYPEPDFVVPAWANVGEEAVFNASGSFDSDGIARYSWAFQDRLMDGPVVNRNFSSPGSWEYSLTVTDTLGAASTLRGAISVYNHTPIPSFVFSPDNGTVATTFTFISTVFDPEGTVTNTTWFFSDGYRAFGGVATHRFADDIGYDINCTVTFIENGTARRASAARTLQVQNSPPTARFTATAESVGKRQLVGFDASTTTDPDEQLAESGFLWAFGDGATGSGKLVAHPYARGGTFNVTLTVTDERGASSSFTLPVRVINQLPVSEFSAPVNVSCNQSFTLDASASRDPDGAIVQYYWEFDDGTRANGRMVTYAFSEPGQHTVSLVVTDDDGASARSQKTIRAEPAPSIPEPRPRPLASNPGMDGRILAGAGLLAILLLLVVALAVLARRKGRMADENAGGPSASPPQRGQPGASLPAPLPEAAPSPGEAGPPPTAESSRAEPAAAPKEKLPPAGGPSAQPPGTVDSAPPRGERAAAAPGLPPPAVTHHHPPRVVRAVLPPPPKVVRTIEAPRESEVAVISLDDARVASVIAPGAPPERQDYSPAVLDETWRLTQGTPVKGHVEARPTAGRKPAEPVQLSEGEADPTLPFNPWATRKK
jgi:PKD repeat protein